MPMDMQDWNKEVLETMKKTALILEATKNLEERIRSLEDKIDKVLSMNGLQDVSIAKFQEQLAGHEEQIKKLDSNVDTLTKKLYKLIGILTAILGSIQIVVSILPHIL